MAVTHSSGQWTNFTDQYYYSITSPLVACFRSGTSWRHMKRNERIQGKRKNISTCIVSFFVSTPCLARRKAIRRSKKKKYGQQDREQRAVIGRTLFACNNMQHRSLEVYLTYPLFGTCLSKNPDYLYCMYSTPSKG